MEKSMQKGGMDTAALVALLGEEKWEITDVL